MSDLDELLGRLEALLEEADRLEESARSCVFELLDGVDVLHRAALQRLAASLDAGTIEGLRRDPAVAWLFDAYGVGVDQRAAAEAALEAIRPYIHSHAGEVEVLEVHDGVVRVRMSGACSGCTASAITLREGVEEALRDGFPAFAALEVEEDAAPAHAPPGPTLLQIERRPRALDDGVI